jgi:transcriptional regulator GlxA family with amidase domain
LLEHFSLPAFTQALDTIITANLLRAGLFSSRTFGLGEGEVISDLGLVIRPDARIDAASLADLDLLVVCGGYRTELKASEELISLLRTAAERGVSLAGLWNGAWFLGGPACSMVTVARFIRNTVRRSRKLPRPPRSAANLM